MTRLIFLVGLVCLISSMNLSAISENQIESLKNNIESVENSLIIIEAQLLKIQRGYESEKADLMKEKERLAQEKNELKQELKLAELDLVKLERQEQLWEASETSLKNLKENINQTEKEARAVLLTRNIIAAGGLAVAGGSITYQASQDAWLSLGVGAGAGLLTFLALQFF